MANAFLGLAGIAPVTAADLNSNSSTAKYDTGGLAWMRDKFGPRVFKYVQNRSGSAKAQGELSSSVGGVDGQTSAGTITGGSTTTAITSGLTANVHVGGLLQILDNADSPGAAPEAEVGSVSAQTATLITTDSDLPFTAAIATGDTAVLYGMWNIEDSADGDYFYVVQGVVVAASLSDGYFGFVCAHGMSPRTILKSSTALAKGDPIVADAACVGPCVGTSDAARLQIGSAPFTITNDLVSPYHVPVLLTCGLGSNVGTIDASA